MNNKIKVFSGSSNIPLAKEIADYMDIELSGIEIKKFKDGEISIKIEENVRGVDFFIIQSTCCPANDNIMELLLIIDAAFRASARRITAVIPYFGYARQDRKVEPRVPISAKLVANILQAAGMGRLLTMDLHADQIQGFFDVPVDNLFASPIVIDYLKNLHIENSVIVSPDAGGVDRARFLARNLKSGIALIDKRRPEANVCEVMHVVGEVRDKNCILIDDMVDTGGSITTAATALKNNGARDVYCVATHPVLSANAKERLLASEFKEIIFANTIYVPEETRGDKIKVLSTAPLFGEAIKRIHDGTSISSLFVKL